MTTTNNSRLLVLLVLAAFAACALLYLRNGEHANLHHPEAPSLRVQMCQNCRPGNDRDHDGRRRVEFYYSSRLGTLLILLRLDGTQAGGMVLKITAVQNREVTALLERSYERTCFVADELYWSRVIVRDGYAQLPVALTSATLAGSLAAVLAALRYVVRKLKDDGHHDLSGRLEREIDDW